MGFPEEVSSAALVACGRCCCICHKFCGTKIELHHIVQKAYGGDDTFENCIPLCFDCHSDMGRADPKHPKGKHYTETELKAHRDNWYHRIKTDNSENCGEICISDKKLFKKICDVFNDSLRYCLKDADLRGTHPRKVFESLAYLLHEEDDPFFEFLNVELEKLRGNLFDCIRKFIDYWGINTFTAGRILPEDNATHLWLLNQGQIPPGGEDYEKFYEENYERFEAEAERLNELATEVWNSYNTFVKSGRRLLKE